VIARLRRLRAEVLGLNRRNHAYLFAHNARDRYHLVDDKRASKAALAAVGVPVPALHAECDVQWGVRRLGDRLAAASDFVLKPARGAGGAGIVVIVGRRDALFVKASGRALGRRDLEAHACDVIAGAYSPGARGDVLLVEERVVAEDVLATLAYRGVPDVRVLVFRGIPTLAMLRLPTRRSDGRANLHLGGVGVGVDLVTGRTTHAILGRRAVEVHPDLGVPLGGVAVPCWQDVLETAVRAAEAVQLGFLGVDVVLDRRHGPLVLELNARPGLGIQLANRRGLRPLLDAVASATVPGTAAARVALGQRLAGGWTAEGAPGLA
jgi:alpha-L-glutamate ligase-like protein